MTRTPLAALAFAAALAPSWAGASSLASVATAPDPIPDAAPPAAALDASATPSPRDVNVHVNPVGLLFEVLLAEVDVRVRPNVSAGAMLMYSRTFDIPSWGVGGYAILTREGDDVMDDAWHLRPFAVYQRVEDPFFGDDFHILSAGTSLGYQWFWDSGFNARLGAGLHLSYAPGADWIEGNGIVAGGGSSTGIGVGLDAAVGYAF